MVVGDLRTVTEDHDVAALIDAAHAAVAETNVLGVAEDRADGKGDVGRFESGRRHLVEQRLKRVEVVLVDDGHAHVATGQTLGGGDPGEPSPKDDDVRQ